MSPFTDYSVSTLVLPCHFDHSGRTSLTSSASQIRSAKQLDALAAVPPMASADRYTEVLTNADVATLKPLIDNGMGANTHGALASDLTYLEAWCRAAIGRPLPWLADPELVLEFIAHHLWDPNQKVIDPSNEMPVDVIEDPWKERSSRFGGQTLPRPSLGGSPRSQLCTSGKVPTLRSTIPALRRLSG
jgi:hypothetical protein